MAMERAVLPSCWINRKERAAKIIYITYFVPWYWTEKQSFSQEEHYAIFEKQKNKQKQRNVAVIVSKINETMFVPNFW